MCLERSRLRSRPSAPPPTSPPATEPSTRSPSRRPAWARSTSASPPTWSAAAMSAPRSRSPTWAPPRPSAGSTPARSEERRVGQERTAGRPPGRATTGKRYRDVSGAQPSALPTLGAATDVTAGYGAQYKVTFKATGLGALDVSQSANVVSGSDVGTAITVADLGTAAAERWFDAGKIGRASGRARADGRSAPGSRDNRQTLP